MRKIVGFMAACLGLVALVLLVIWISGGFEDVRLSPAGWTAYALGVVLTSVLGTALMALVFYSDRSGQDEASGGTAELVRATSRTGEETAARRPRRRTRPS
jgi:hypothetical protein